MLLLRTTEQTGFCFHLNPDDFEGQLQFQSDDGKSDNEDESSEEREPYLDLLDNG